MAIDLRKPEGKCLIWLRRTLLDLESDGVLEATEEHRPAHFHVAVFGDEYERYVEQRTRPAATVAGGGEDDDATYRVRAGDSLWSIAHRHETTVRDLIVANRLGDTTIQPGQKLVIPGPR
jgi:LysM repeat protein